MRILLQGPVGWRAECGEAPWEDANAPLLSSASQALLATYARSLWHITNDATATAQLPMDLTIAIGDTLHIVSERESVSGRVSAVEHLVRDGQALTRVELKVAVGNF